MIFFTSSRYFKSISCATIERRHYSFWSCQYVQYFLSTFIYRIHNLSYSITKFLREKKVYVFQYFISSIIINLNLFLFNNVARKRLMAKIYYSFYIFCFVGASLSRARSSIKIKKNALRNGDFIFDYNIHTFSYHISFK